MIMLSVEFWIFSNYPLISDFSQEFYCVRKKSRLNVWGNSFKRSIFNTQIFVELLLFFTR